MGNAEVTSSAQQSSSEAGSQLLEELAKHPRRLNFRDPTQREVHLQAFLAWLIDDNNIGPSPKEVSLLAMSKPRQMMLDAVGE